MGMRLVLTVRKTEIAPMIFKAALLASAVSLLAYIPYKYATHLHAINGLYAFVLPWSSIVAMAGVGLALFPNRVLRLPLPVRAGIGSIALVWMITGLLCVPMLVGRIIAAPASGVAATFQMLAQHVFLSLSVAGLLLSPRIGRTSQKQFFLIPKRSL